MDDGMKLWTEVPLVGIDEIDEEHRHFIGLLDRFNHADTRGLPEAELYAMLAEVVLYTEQHFTSEEALMQEAGYPFLDQHRMMHDTAEAEVHRLASGTASEDEIRDTLGSFMLNWLLLHIQSADRKFGEWLSEAGRCPGLSPAAGASAPRHDAVPPPC